VKAEFFLQLMHKQRRHASIDERFRKWKRLEIQHVPEGESHLKYQAVSSGVLFVFYCSQETGQLKTLLMWSLLKESCLV
jgi:hypothetical protein